jgi:hypothetical protein
MSQRWTLDSVAWSAFEASKVDAQLLALVKTASLVEANAADYVVYLRNVFAGDADFIALAEQWGEEERLHGEALGRWAELADPQFSFVRAINLNSTLKHRFAAHAVRNSSRGKWSKLARRVFTRPSAMLQKSRF